jgi:hypothetical protein
MGLAALGVAMVLVSLSGATHALAGDPNPLPQPAPTEPPPQPTTPPEPTQPPPPPPPIIIVTQAVPTVVVPTPVPPTPVPPTAVPTQLSQVVAGVSALPRTGSGADSDGTNWVLLFLGGTMFAAAAGTAGLARKASKS